MQNKMIINALPGKIRTGKFKSLFDLALEKISTSGLLRSGFYN